MGSHRAHPPGRATTTPDAPQLRRAGGGLDISICGRLNRFFVCRFKLRDGDKMFLPLTLCQHQTSGALDWPWKGYPAPRPLYNLPQFAARPDATVIVCEGEKSADAAAKLFPDAVTTTAANVELTDLPLGANHTRVVRTRRGRPIRSHHRQESAPHSPRRARCGVFTRSPSAGSLRISPYRRA